MIADFRTLQASFVQIMRVLLHLRLQLLARPSGPNEELIGKHEEPRNEFANLASSAKPQREAPTNGWRNMSIALVVIGVILLFVRLQF